MYYDVLACVLAYCESLEHLLNAYIVKKKNMVIIMIFVSLHYQSRVKGYSQLLPCEAPNHIGNGFSCIIG